MWHHLPLGCASAGWSRQPERLVRVVHLLHHNGVRERAESGGLSDVWKAENDTCCTRSDDTVCRGRPGCPARLLSLAVTGNAARIGARPPQTQCVDHLTPAWAADPGGGGGDGPRCRQRPNQDRRRQREHHSYEREPR